MGEATLRTIRARCITCNQMHHSAGSSPDAYRMWSQRHADATGHTVVVENSFLRTYRPRNPNPEETP